MFHTIVEILVCSLAFMIGAHLLKGVEIKNFGQAILVALLVGILDFTLGNVLRFITLGLLSWGIFTWFLNAILIQVADYFLTGFKVKNFWWAFILAGVVSLISGVILKFAL